MMGQRSFRTFKMKFIEAIDHAEMIGIILLIHKHIYDSMLFKYSTVKLYCEYEQVFILYVYNIRNI